MKCIIDADSIIYIASDQFKKESQFNNKTIKIMVLARVDSIIKRILKETDSDEYIGFYGSEDHKNFRYDIAKTKVYKGQRKEPEPYLKHWSPIIKNHMKNKWHFHDCGYIEADDAVIITAMKYSDSWIVSPDKDLRQIPGKFFDYKAKKDVAIKEVSNNEAKLNFWSQILKGDTCDNIPGCPGVGPGAIKKLLSEDMSWFKMYSIVRDTYINTLYSKPKAKAEKLYIKEHIKQWRKDHAGETLKKAIKEEEILIAIDEFNETYSSEYTRAGIYNYLIEQFQLIKMLRKPKYNFIIPEWEIYKTEVRVKKREYEQKEVSLIDL